MSTSTSPASRPARPGAGPVVVGVLAGLAHLGPGFLIVVSGLVAPLWAVALMLAGWIALAVVLVRLVQRGSWWTPVVPVAAMAAWFGVLILGERLLGWTA